MICLTRSNFLSTLTVDLTFLLIVFLHGISMSYLKVSLVLSAGSSRRFFAHQDALLSSVILVGFV